MSNVLPGMFIWAPRITETTKIDAWSTPPAFFLKGVYDKSSFLLELCRTLLRFCKLNSAWNCHEVERLDFFPTKLP